MPEPSGARWPLRVSRTGAGGLILTGFPPASGWVVSVVVEVSTLLEGSVGGAVVGSVGGAVVGSVDGSVGGSVDGSALVDGSLGGVVLLDGSTEVGGSVELDGSVELVDAAGSVDGSDEGSDDGAAASTLAPGGAASLAPVELEGRTGWPKAGPLRPRPTAATTARMATRAAARSDRRALPTMPARSPSLRRWALPPAGPQPPELGPPV